MSEAWLIGLEALIGCVAVILLLVMLRKRRDAIRGRKNVMWLQGQMERALRQIVSSDEDEILAGCQTLAILNDRRARLNALLRITELTKHPNPRIAKQAAATYERIVASL